MAKWGSDDAWVLIDGYDVTSTSTELEQSVEAQIEETHGLGDAWIERDYVGVKQWQITQNGFYDDAALSSNVALVSSVGSTRVMCYGLEGHTVGKKFVGGAGAVQTNFQRVVTRGELHKANATYQGSGRLWDGVILHELSAETADGDTEGADSVDNAASSSNGGAWFVQVTALTLGGYTNLTVKLRHSADDITYADKDTATAVTAAPAAEARTLTSTINRYTATSWDFTGTGTSPTATLFVGLARG